MPCRGAAYSKTLCNGIVWRSYHGIRNCCDAFSTREKWKQVVAQDDQTLRFYAQEAAAYTSRGRTPSQRRIEAFLSMLPAEATILELGCGAGQDSEFMIAQGFNVYPTDGTPEIAQAAEKRLGRPVATLLFGDLDEDGIFDGIWANACLLHVPRADLSGLLARIDSHGRAGMFLPKSAALGRRQRE